MRCFQTLLGIQLQASIHSMLLVESYSISFWLDIDLECRWNNIPLQPRKIRASVSAWACFSSCSGLFESSSQQFHFAGEIMVLLESVESPILHRKVQIPLMWIPLLYQTWWISEKSTFLSYRSLEAFKYFEHFRFVFKKIDPNFSWKKSSVNIRKYLFPLKEFRERGHKHLYGQVVKVWIL